LIAVPPYEKQKKHLKGCFFVLAFDAVGIGLAGRAFVCMRMPLRATNSTQVLFVLRHPSVPDRGRSTLPATGNEWHKLP
jgi:hypothetical protein